MSYTKKDTIRVMIYTSRFRVEGDMHILAGARLTDQLNVKMKDFFALTNVKILASTEEAILQESKYAAIMRNAIIMVSPLEADEGILLPEE